MKNPQDRKFDAVAFDLLTALIDSWTLWNEVAGGPHEGLRWRKRYLEITYGCGVYRPYEELILEAADDSGLSRETAGELQRRWHQLRPWPEAPGVLATLAPHVPLGIATNCSEAQGLAAAALTGGKFSAVVTAETSGFYKPRREIYRALLDALGTEPARTLFVAGSASDVPGAKAAGMPVYWHNRIGLPCPPGAEPEFLQPTLHNLREIVLQSA